MAEKIRDRFELKFIFLLLALLFGLFLILPVLTIAFQSLGGDTGISSSFYSNIFAKANFISALKNSISISAAAGILTTLLAFILAYTVNYTNLNRRIKRIISTLAVLPMFLPTITYGFAIIYLYDVFSPNTSILSFLLNFDIIVSNTVDFLLFFIALTICRSVLPQFYLNHL